MVNNKPVSPAPLRYPLELLDEGLLEEEELLDEEELDELDDEELEEELEELDDDELEELDEEEFDDALLDETELQEELLDTELLTLLLLLLLFSAEEDTEVALYEENALAEWDACSPFSTRTAAIIAPPTFRVKRLNRKVARISGVLAPARTLEAAGANGKSIQANRKSWGVGVGGLGSGIDLPLPFQGKLLSAHCGLEKG